MTLTGKGYYIWIVRDCERGDPDRIAAMARASKLTHVIIKIAEGSFPFNIDMDSGYDFARPVIKRLQANNIACWGYQRVYGDFPVQEAETVVKRGIDLGIDGFVVDAEVEYKDKAAAANRYMKILRNNLGSLPLALSSFRYPSYHASFPFSTFLEYCDFNMPQVYWIKSRNGSGTQLQRCLNEFRQIRPYRPIIPTGSTFREHGWFPSDSEVIDFIQVAEKLKIPAVNFWEWGRCRRDLPHLWDLVGDYPYQNPTQVASLPGQYISAMNSKDPDQVLKFYHQNAVHIRAGSAVLGKQAIREWIADFMVEHSDGDYALVDESVERNTHNFRWQVQDRSGEQWEGRDTMGVIDNTIRYHYSFIKQV